MCNNGSWTNSEIKIRLVKTATPKYVRALHDLLAQKLELNTR